MNEMNQIVSENLKSLRNASCYTQEQVASFVGIERSAYGNYELGIREVPYDVIEKLSNLYGCEAVLLYDKNAKSEIAASAFRLSDMETGDLKEIAIFQRIIKSYLKMERLLRNESK